MDSEAAVPRLFLAPMAGVTNTVFRRMAKELGADILTTEFVSAEGILHRNERTRRFLDFVPAERPLGVQLFGADPERLGAAVRAVLDWVAPDFIDLNFGCPVNKVVAKNGGSSLLRDCPLLAKVARAVVSAAGTTPVTAKIRIGWSASQINAVETSRILAAEGVTRLAVHGRTKEQGYSGLANWEVIDEVARSINIPVIGNGDIDSAEIALRRLSETAVSGLMIGRAAMAHPWIFREIKAALAPSGARLLVPLREKWTFICDHVRQEIAWWNGAEELAVKSLRARLMSYTRGLPGGARLRERLQKTVSLAEVEDIAARHLETCADAQEILCTAAIGR